MKHKLGQTLVEVMIALFVLTTGFLGIVSLLSQSLYLSKNVSTETTATYLAAEGVELAKNILDHDMYQHLEGQGIGWAQGGVDKAFGAGNSSGYELDYSTCANLNNLTSDCTGIQTYRASDYLNLDQATGLYGYGAGVPTPFTRQILVQQDSSNNNLYKVRSRVFWDVSGVSQEIEVDDDFYNWHP